MSPTEVVFLFVFRCSRGSFGLIVIFFYRRISEPIPADSILETMVRLDLNEVSQGSCRAPYTHKVVAIASAF